MALATARFGVPDSLPSPIARVGPIHSMGRSTFRQPHSLIGQRALRNGDATQVARPVRARSSRGLHKLAGGFQLAAGITLICAGCARMRWSTSALTCEKCSTSFEWRSCTCLCSDYSRPSVPGAFQAAVQLLCPVSCGAQRSPSGAARCWPVLSPSLH